MYYVESTYKKLADRKIKLIPEIFFTALTQVYKDNWWLDEENLINQIKECAVNSETSKIFHERFLYNYDFDIRILIHIPELTISNTKLNHLITDLFLSINFYSHENKIRDIYVHGNRSSLTLEEIEKNYFHSHLNKDISPSFSNFCFGSNTAYYDSKNKLFYNPTLEDCLFFLFILNQSLKWESKEGVPYRYMNNIGKSLLRKELPEYIVKDVSKIIKFQNLKFKINNNNIEVLPTQDLENQLFNQIIDTKYKNYTCYKTENGEYLDLNNTINHSEYAHYEGMELFKFKNEIVKFKINNLINDKEKYNNTKNNAPYPQLTQGICNYLSSKITKAHIINSRIKRKNTIESTPECCKQDQILVL